MISFFVPGLPISKGSKKSFAVPVKGQVNKHGQQKFRGISMEATDAKLKPWAAAVSGQAIDHRPAELWTCPVKLTCKFYFPPANYMLKGKAQHQEFFHIKKPDLDKIIRAIKDALTNVIYKDDCYVVEESLVKMIGFHPGVSIMLEESAAWGFVASQQWEGRDA